MADAGMRGAPGGEPGAAGASVHRPNRALPPLKPVHLAAIAGVAVVALLVVILVAALWPRDGVEVPDVVGQSLDDARAALEDLGLRVEERPVPEEAANVGMVVGQDPEPGASVERGSTVGINVGVAIGPSPPAPVKVPDVRGKARTDAIAELEALGLTPATRPVPRDDVTPGDVVDQEPAPGEEVAPGSQVLLGIARKPAAKANLIAWVLGLGPGAPEGPPEFRAYQLLLDPDDCPELARQLRAGEMEGLPDDAVRLYQAAANACLAAFHDRPAEWTRAERALSTLDRPESCIDASAYGLLNRLVMAHRANPDGTFRVSEKRKAEAPCPANARVKPRHGPMGRDVRVFADHIDRVEIARVKFLVDGELVNGNGSIDPSPDGDAIRLKIDGGSEAASAQWACVYLEATQDWNATGAWFAIDPPPGSTAPRPDPRSPPTDVDCPPPSGT